jgi:hypothetical protein
MDDLTKRLEALLRRYAEARDRAKEKPLNWQMSFVMACDCWWRNLDRQRWTRRSTNRRERGRRRPRCKLTHETLPTKTGLPRLNRASRKKGLTDGPARFTFGRASPKKSRLHQAFPTSVANQVGGGVDAKFAH